jgi:hypothetical protein
MRRAHWPALILMVTGACAARGPAAPTTPAAPGDPTERYLERVIAGDRAALVASFAGEPAVDDPLGGRARGADAFDRFLTERQAWLVARSARVTPGRTTRVPERTVVEAALDLREGERSITLPIAVVGDRAPDGRLRAVRVYHSTWPLTGAHRVRPPLLPAAPALPLKGAVAAYQRALAAGDVEGILATFEPDGYFREPSGGIYVHRGPAALRAFMTQILGTGGIGLEHATLTDDGVVAAIEFNAVRFGTHQLSPQAGLAVYERGPSGRLAAARIYDDVNVEALAAPPPP